MATLKNLIPNPSFETSASWAGVTYSTSHALFGAQSSLLPTGVVQVNQVVTPIQPILNHRYYGRHYIKTTGNSAPADCRFEWFAGDGAGLNWVFGYNRGNHPDWYMESAIQTVTAINGTNYRIRNFVVNGTYACYCDGLMLVDLTDAFGAGNEPTKEWCDTNIPFFEAELELIVLNVTQITAVSLSPNPVNINSALAVSVTATETTITLQPEITYSGEHYSGETYSQGG